MAKESAKDLWRIYSDRFFTVYSLLCRLKAKVVNFIYIVVSPIAKLIIRGYNISNNPLEHGMDQESFA